jgi:outer membrane protein assembly factor BamB
MKTTILSGTFFLTGIFSFGQSKIYEWHGPERSGIYNETNLLKVWPENGPAEIWATEGIGNGYGSPTITENGIYITGETDSTAYLYHLNFDGKIARKIKLGAEWVKSFPGSRSAPTIVDDLLYTGTGTGDLYCVNLKDGKIAWSKKFTDDFQGQMTFHGFTDAPVVSGDILFWLPGGSEYNVVALNRFTGNLIWSSKGLGERSAYTQSKLIKLASREIFTTFTAYNFLAFDANTGQLLWNHPQDNTPPDKRAPGYGDTHCNTPIYENGSIYYFAGDGNGAVRLDLTGDGTGISQVWRNQSIDNYMAGAVKIGNHLYSSTSESKQLVSIDANTGTIKDSLKIGTGAVISADRNLYYYSQKGELYLIQPGNGVMKVLSTFKIRKGTKEHFSHPVIANGILYQRHGNVLMAFDIKSSSGRFR